MIKLNNNRILIEKEHYSIIKPDNTDDFIPAWCEICEDMLTTLDDEIAYQNYKCCDMCAQQFARPNLERWLSNWRPNEQELKQAISRR